MPEPELARSWSRDQSRSRNPSSDADGTVSGTHRTQPILPMRQGIPERQTHGCARHGVTTLFAALEMATGQVTDACHPRHRNQEFLRFLKGRRLPRRRTAPRLRQLRRAQARRRPGMARPQPQDHRALHPGGCSRLNLVECFFSIITRQAIRRGSNASGRQFTQTIGTFIDGWNDHPAPLRLGQGRRRDPRQRSTARRLRPTLLQTTSSSSLCTRYSGNSVGSARSLQPTSHLSPCQAA